MADVKEVDERWKREGDVRVGKRAVFKRGAMRGERRRLSGLSRAHNLFEPRQQLVRTRSSVAEKRLYSVPRQQLVRTRLSI